MRTTQLLTQQSRSVITHCISLLLSCISTIKHHPHTHVYTRINYYYSRPFPLRLAFLVREPHDASETAAFDRLPFVCFSVARPADSSWFMEPLVLIAVPRSSPSYTKTEESKQRARALRRSTPTIEPPD
ncbi:hypothetical protein CGRA01v4_03460 [Colletotrichum graminicola]|nr:hypothetical protein CGRA01v4_03460 [Colletotrichum graminicola]